ncbi:MAG: tetracycline resistance MFS efflux pump [Gemmatimonadales bacterium]|nr:Tetracycline resistance protein, class B [bacterium HR33]GIW53394.1 MAG: tetracycline resistance MFS efflux pump [Gemmatimonadales bacterium]
MLMATAFVDMVGGSMIFPLLPFYALKLNADPWLIGWMIAAFWIAQLASAPLWGRVSDRYGRRPALLAGLAASAAGFLVFAFAVEAWMLLLSRLVQGAGGGTTGVAQAYVGDAVEPKDRAKALGWLSAATSAGVMIGPAIGSLATTLGSAAPGLIAAGLCLLNVFYAWRWLPESAPHRRHNPGAKQADPSGPRRPVRAVVWEVIASPRGDVPRLVWIYTMGMLGFMSMIGVLALYLERAFGVTEQTIGLFFVYTGALSVVMRAVILGKLVERFGETGVMRMGATLLALGLMGIPLPHTILGLAAVIALVPIGTALLFPATSALVTHRAPPWELGQVMGVQQAFGSVARVAGPIWATAAFQALGIDVPFYVSGAVVCLVLLLALRVKPSDVAFQVEPTKAAG